MAIVETGPLTMATASSGGGYTGNAVTIFQNTTAPLPWSTLASGSELFDLTDPSNPLVLVAGVYSFAVSIEGGGNAEPCTMLGLTVSLAGSFTVFSLTKHLNAGDAATVTVENIAIIPSNAYAIAAAIVTLLG